MSKSWEEKHVSLGSAIIVAAITLVIGVGLGIAWNSVSAKILPFFGVKTYQTNNWSALDEVYDELLTNYDGDLDKTELIEGAKKGLVAAAGDVYTEYMTASEASDYQDLLHGEAGSGVGIEMALRDGYVRVIRTLPDNPAGKAGVKAGDIIYKIDGEEVYAETSDVIAGKLRGDEGTTVELTVVRDGEEKTFQLKREPINNVSAYIDYDGDTAIITLTRFDDDTGTIVQNFIKSSDFKDHKIKNIILDLRNNGGGYVSAAKDLLSLWIDGEPVLIQKSKNHADTTTYANRGQALLKDYPTVVLINGSSASASEIVAGALKDYGAATLIGETTFGKGVVQTLLNLSSNTLLKVTTARWFTPNGTSINGEGISPDQEVVLTYDDTNHSRDPQKDAAKKFLQDQTK